MANINKHNTIDHNQLHSGVSNRRLLIIVLIAIALISLLWIWKTMEINNLVRQNQLANERLKQRVSNQLDSTLKQQLVLMSKPLVWAIQAKMVDGNMDDVDRYLKQLVKEKNFEEIAIVNPKGSIIASTDQRETGHPYSIFYNKAFLNVDHTQVNIQRGRNLIITSPISETNKNLGVLSFKYILPAYK